MGIIFSEDWESYAVNTTFPAYPSRLGGLWFGVGVFNGHITDEAAYQGTKSLRYDVSGTIGWEDSTHFYDAGTFIYAFRGSPDTGVPFGSLSLYSAAIPRTVPFPDPIQLLRLQWEHDGSLTARGPQDVFMQNSGYPHTDTTPLGTISTTPYALEADAWFIFQLNVSFSKSGTDQIIASIAVHINKQPILACTKVFSALVSILPTDPDVLFNHLNCQLVKNNFSYMDIFSLDSDGEIEPGLGDPSVARITQGVLEPITLPTTNLARITQGVIELSSLPGNNARITQAVIEILTTGGGAATGGWKVYEA